MTAPLDPQIRDDLERTVKAMFVGFHMGLEVEQMLMFCRVAIETQDPEQREAAMRRAAKKFVPKMEKDAASRAKRLVAMITDTINVGKIQPLPDDEEEADPFADEEKKSTPKDEPEVAAAKATKH